MSQIFYFQAVKGMMNWSNANSLVQFLLDNEGKNMYANIDKVKGVRSLNQNSYYWFYLEIIARETGNTADMLHRLFKGLFLPKEIVKFKGKEYPMSGSTTKLSKTDMGEYLDKIAAECEVPLPDPQKALEVNYQLWETPSKTTP